MKNRKSETQVKESIPRADLLPLYIIASQMMEDVEHLYGQSLKRQNMHSLLTNQQAAVETPNTKLPILKNGELIVIATRCKELREEFLLRLSHHVAITNKQVVAVYSVNESLIQFTRKLIGAMAGIPSDINILDGNLNDVEIGRLTSELTKLCASQIYMYPSQTILLGWLSLTTHKLMKCTCDIGLVLVDAAQYLIDNQHQSISAQQSIIALKGLAEILRIPVVALYQLDPYVENHPSTLTPA